MGNLITKILLDHNHVKALKRYRTVNVLMFERHLFSLTFNGQQAEVIFKPLTLNAVKFLPAVNGQRLTPFNFDLTMPSYGNKPPLPTVLMRVFSSPYLNFVKFRRLSKEVRQSSVNNVLPDEGPCYRTLAFVVSNKQLPCDPEYLFTARVFGVNGKHTNVTWDPPRYSPVKLNSAHFHISAVVSINKNVKVAVLNFTSFFKSQNLAQDSTVLFVNEVLIFSKINRIFKILMMNFKKVF